MRALVIALVLLVTSWAQAGEKERLSRLEALYSGGDPMTRAHVVERLAAWPDEATAPRAHRLLQLALADPEPSLRAAAATAVGRRRAHEAAPALRKLLDDERDPGAQAAAILALAHVGAPTDGSTINAFLMRRDTDVRRAALLALGILKVPGAARTARLLAQEPGRSDPDHSLRAAAIVTLGKTGSPSDGAWLARLATRKRPEQDSLPWMIRGAIAEALGHLKGEGTTQTLVAMLGDPDDRVGVTAGAALAQQGQVRPLLQSVGSPSIRVRAAAVGGIFQGRVKQGYPLLRSLAERDRSRIVRWAATNALFRLGDASADARVLDALNSSDPAISLAAQRLLYQRIGHDHGQNTRKWREAIAHWRLTK